MKIFKIAFNSMLILFFVSSCDLTNGEVENICGKNAPIVLNNEDKCANAIGIDYRLESGTSSEQITIRFVFGTGNFQIGLNTTSITNKTYSYPGEVDFSFPELNKGGSGTLTITLFDRAERKISGHFDLSAEAAANYTAYNYVVSGSFSNVGF